MGPCWWPLCHDGDELAAGLSSLEDTLDSWKGWEESWGLAEWVTEVKSIQRAYAWLTTGLISSD